MSTQPESFRMSDVIDFLNRLRQSEREAWRYADELEQERKRLHEVCRNVYEVWAGSEGIPIPETAAEGYLLHLIEQMREEAKEGLK